MNRNFIHLALFFLLVSCNSSTITKNSSWSVELSLNDDGTIGLAQVIGGGSGEPKNLSFGTSFFRRQNKDFFRGEFTDEGVKALRIEYPISWDLKKELTVNCIKKGNRKIAVKLTADEKMKFEVHLNGLRTPSELVLSDEGDYELTIRIAKKSPQSTH